MHFGALQTLAWISEGASQSWCSPAGEGPARVSPSKAPGRSYAGAAGGKLLLLGVVSTHHQLETLMEIRTVNNLAPAAPHDDAVRCLLLCRTGNYAASGGRWPRNARNAHGSPTSHAA